MALDKQPAPQFFETPAAFRAWLEKHHETAHELWVGMYKVGSGRPSITWPQAVDQALCFGWIDGIRRSIDENSYMNRFTPRKRTSTWSLKNLKRMEELIAEGLVTRAGLAALEARREDRTGTYSFERDEAATLPTEYQAVLGANEEARTFFEAQAPWYQRSVLHWITSAKREETRQKRLEQLIQDSAAGRTVPPFTRRTSS